MAERDTPPPVGEEIHLPGPSIIPILNAAGVAIALVGITTTIVLVIAGVLLFVGTTIIWIRDSRRDIQQLPPEHH